MPSLECAAARGLVLFTDVTVRPKDPRVEFAFLAKNARPAFPGGGLLNVTELGLHDLYAQESSLPDTTRLWLIGRLQWRSEDADKQFQITYAVRAYNEKSQQPRLVNSYPAKSVPTS